jgi:predicted phage tail protein
VSGCYDALPLLRLVECYLLDALTPKLARSLSPEAATWQQAIEAALQLPPGLRDSLRADWTRDRAEAAVAGHELDAERFAVAVADAFVD